MIIYKTTNTINNMIYVGFDSHENPEYFGSGKLIRWALKKYGKENFKKEVLQICNESNWSNLEKYWIKKLNSRNNKIGYNITEGGYGLGSGKNHPQYGKHLTNEHKKKVSKGMIGRKFSLEHRKHLSETRRGIKFTEETKRKMALAKLGKQGYWTGKKRSRSTKRKISQSHKRGFLLNPERYL